MLSLFLYTIIFSSLSGLIFSVYKYKKLSKKFDAYKNRQETRIERKNIQIEELKNSVKYNRNLYNEEFKKCINLTEKHNKLENDYYRLRLELNNKNNDSDNSSNTYKKSFFISGEKNKFVSVLFE